MTYQAKTVRDERTVDVLNTIFDSLYIDLGVANNFGDFNDTLRDVIFNDKPIASSIAEGKATAEAAMKDFVETWIGE